MPFSPIVRGSDSFRERNRLRSHVSEALGRHAAAEVLDGDVRAPALAAQDDADPFASLPGLGVGVGGVRHELVERVLRVLVGVSGCEDGLGHVADPQANALRFRFWHADARLCSLCSVQRAYLGGVTGPSATPGRHEQHVFSGAVRCS